MIEIESVRVDRGGRTVLADLDLSLTESRIGILGANGSGKSTFARLLNGLVLPAAGTVHVFGLDTRAEAKAVRRKVGFLFQNPDSQIVYPTVGEDVAFGLKPLKLSQVETARRVEATLVAHGLGGLGDRLAHELSGGERQLLALAGIMVLDPALLVLDEPTTLLDRRNRRRLMAELERIARPVILVTHDLDLVSNFERIIVFEKGRIAFDGPAAAGIDAYLALTA